MNVVEALGKATDFLDRNGIESPRLNAELLLSQILKLSRVELYTHYDTPVAIADSDRFKEKLMKRSRHYPLQYLTGEAGFRSATYSVREGVFIPRPETEVLVEEVLKALPDDRSIEVLDVGTGTGNVAISIAIERPLARVLATDVSEAAIETCALNAASLEVAERVRPAAGDLFEPVDEDTLYDAVVSNPPYIAESEAGELQPEVKDFEPPGALFAADGGLAFIELLVAQAPARIAPGGLLALEIGESQGAAVRSMLEEAGFVGVEILPDLAGRDRVALGRLP